MTAEGADLAVHNSAMPQSSFGAFMSTSISPHILISLLHAVLFFGGPINLNSQDHSSPSRGTGSIRGYVYCADTGRPARFATVRLQSIRSLGSVPDASGLHAANAAVTTTGLDGSFSVDGLAPDTYLASTTFAGYMRPLAQFTWGELSQDAAALQSLRKRMTDSLPQVEVAAGQTASIAIRLERGAEISGTVSYDDGTPAPELPIRVYRQALKSGKWEQVQELDLDSSSMRETDSRGHLRLEGLPAGKYLLAVVIDMRSHSGNALFGGQVQHLSGASHPGVLEVYFGDTVRQVKAAGIQVSPGEARSDADIQIPLSKLHTVAGTVAAQFDGHLLKAANIGLKYPDDDSVSLHMHLGEDGTFRSPFVPEGEYVMIVSASPETTPAGQHAYATLSVPLTVHGDQTSINVLVPDAH